MLTIFGHKQPYCDGVSRRHFLKIGAFTFGAASLTLADIFRAEARAGVTGNRHKSVINIFLGGGPPHQDMWDIKTEAPSEIRGEFKPIATNVPGIQIGEVFPRIAARMDKCVVIRSVAARAADHDAFQCMTGWKPRELRSRRRPSQPRCSGCQAPRALSIRRCRRSSAWRHERRRSAGRTRANRVSSGPPLPRSSPTVPAWPT